ncbi:hypothetical protein [Spirochaeta isovalerica]|uniref:Uncharacterized protein n=1 Tax=Spirochaeta isovalerica TaxID=150 RepID=A0A841R8L2_9SPIO|nr:hypothetical protein [Spirochaeta isovalerica]MBB6479691.1 hypothetical protein [Spirochaeta isovalerica]MBN2659169.1 hypothetical protein [Spirochaetales bacterium]
MLNQFSLYDEQLMALQRKERLMQYAEAERIYRMTASLRKNRVIEAAGRFLVETGNRLLAIAS